jgi:hypothetical protein
MNGWKAVTLPAWHPPSLASIRSVVGNIRSGVASFPRLTGKPNLPTRTRKSDSEARVGIVRHWFAYIAKLRTWRPRSHPRDGCLYDGTTLTPSEHNYRATDSNAVHLF